MAKAKTQFVCAECGGASVKWAGQCPHCGAWNTLAEARVEAAVDHRYAPLAPTAAVQSLREVQAREMPRISSGIEEFDRVLGGGLVHGGVVLLGGDPGIGKSTLLLQSLAALSATTPVLYVSGEESAAQIALRARRLGLQGDALRLLAEISLERIVATVLAEKPAVVVVDSIQTVYSGELQSAPGSVAQVRECAAQLTRMAKQAGLTLVLVGHVTKEGSLAGPRVLEHMVDTVLYFEGDTHSSFRLIRAIKNRFGAINELGVFAMTDRGLKGVANPSALFLSQHDARVAGSCVLVTQEARDRCWSRSRRWSTPPTCRTRAGCRSASTRSGWRCCSPCCIVTPGSRRSTRTYSSTPSAACASPSRPPIWQCSSRSCRRCATGRCRADWWRSARSAWRARSVPPRAGRSACARRPSWVSRWR
jgi:DNA repair protein RadA/Sms